VRNAAPAAPSFPLAAAPSSFQAGLKIEHSTPTAARQRDSAASDEEKVYKNAMSIYERGEGEEGGGGSEFDAVKPGAASSGGALAALAAGFASKEAFLASRPAQLVTVVAAAVVVYLVAGSSSAEAAGPTGGTTITEQVCTTIKQPIVRAASPASACSARGQSAPAFLTV